MSNDTIVIACLCLNASEYRVYMYKNKTKQKNTKIILQLLFFSDTEYRTFLSESYEYEYEEYPNQDNYGSNKPEDTKTASIGSTKKTSIRSTTPPTTDEIYVMHQQDHLLLSQLHPTFPPVWME